MGYCNCSISNFGHWSEGSLNPLKLRKWVQKINSQHLKWQRHIPPKIGTFMAAKVPCGANLRCQTLSFWAHLFTSRVFKDPGPLTNETHTMAQLKYKNKELLVSPGRCVRGSDIARVEDVSRASVNLRSYPLSPRPHPLLGRIVARCRHLALSRTL